MTHHGKDICEMSVLVKIKFKYDREKLSLNQAMDTAEHLSIEPNLHTIEEGVQVLEVNTYNQTLHT